MPRVLAIDIGSSSVKAAILTGPTPPDRTVRCAFRTAFDDTDAAPRAEVKLVEIERAVRRALRELGDAVRRADLIASTTMSPSWLAMDAQGNALTSVVTHQDRRSIAEARQIESEIGRARHLKLAGNRPFPGGISSTTARWHARRRRSVVKQSPLVGHLGTWLAFALTGERVMDLSNAGFTGLMDVHTAQWSDDLIDASGLNAAQLPRLVSSDAIAGTVTNRAARRWGLTVGTPVIAGCVDGSAAMLAAGGTVPRAGQLVNVCGSTDVLALCVDRPMPAEDLLTRPLGVGGKWLSVSTIAAAGSALDWMARTFYAELTPAAFHRRVARTLRGSRSSRVEFAADLAGSRTAMEMLDGKIRHLTLSTSRDEVLGALLDRLLKQSAARVERLRQLGVPIRSDVLVTGGGSALPGRGFRATWPARFKDHIVNEATLRGVWALARRAH